MAECSPMRLLSLLGFRGQTSPGVGVCCDEVHVALRKAAATEQSLRLELARERQEHMVRVLSCDRRLRALYAEVTRLEGDVERARRVADSFAAAAGDGIWHGTEGEA